MNRAGVVFTLVVALSLVVVSAGHAARVRNGRILISNNYDRIASIRPDGAGYRILLRNNHDPAGGRWSPDKTRFAYGELSPELRFDLHVRRADGSGDKLVASADAFRFSWSPDGRYLAYVAATGSSVLDGACDGIRVVNVDTLADRAVTDGPACRADDPQWSPAGNEIAFVDGQDPGTVDPDLDIYKVDVTTGEVTQLTDSPALDRAPEWSPDGSSIVFESSRDHELAGRVGGCMRRTEIYRMNGAGTHQVRLTGKLHNPDCNATWSSDGRHIAWTTSLKRKEGERQRPTEVHVMRRDGTAAVRLTNGRRLPSYGGDFSPDGRRIVFTVYHPADDDDRTPYFDLYTARLDGSRRIHLTRGGTRYGSPDW